MWDEDRKIAREKFGRKRKSTGCIYLTGSKFYEAGDHLTMSSCLEDAVINFDPRIGKYIKNINCTDSALIKQ